MPGPMVLAYRPSRNITSRSYSKAILSPEAKIQQAITRTIPSITHKPVKLICINIILTPFL
ncbi:MAG: hypothetical protein ACTSXK_09885 [Promethearchaeota archaeon]